MRLSKMPDGVDTGSIEANRFLENLGKALEGDWSNNEVNFEYLNCPKAFGTICFLGQVIHISLTWDDQTIGGKLLMPKILSNGSQRWSVLPSVLVLRSVDKDNQEQFTSIYAEGNEISLPTLSGVKVTLVGSCILRGRT